MPTTLFDRVHQEGTPLIDGDQATFVWFGAADPPFLIGDFTDWSARPISLEEREPGVWATTLTFPLNAYLEYGFLYDFGKDDIQERPSDPFNPRLVFNGIDSLNHAFTMPAFQASALSVRQSGVPRGKISLHDLPHGGLLAGGERKLALYHPPVDEPTPLVVVWDGTDYLNRAALNIIVDNLIAQKRIRPIALAMIANAGSARFSEYVQTEATAQLAARAILPFARQHLALVDEKESPGCHGVLGASMGGLMALYTGLRLPQVFGKVISQSGAFYIGGQTEDMLIHQIVDHHPVAPLKIWQDVGALEWLLDNNRRFNKHLVARGYDVTYHEFSGGHNYFMWSQVMGQALESVFGA